MYVHGLLKRKVKIVKAIDIDMIDEVINMIAQHILIYDLD
jgi:hypothetical protein